MTQKPKNSDNVSRTEALGPDNNAPQLNEGVNVLRLMAEPTRLRILSLLQHGEVSVKDLTQILSQSQPRISRHMKLLSEGGLINRFPEGAWVYYRLAETGYGVSLMHTLLAQLDATDAQLHVDRVRLRAQKQAQHDAALAYFDKVAEAWDQMQFDEVAAQDVEQAILSMLGDRPVAHMLDLGTGTGRMLELLAPLYAKALGVDSSQAMIRAARAHLEAASLNRAQVRLMDFTQDVTTHSAEDKAYDLVVLHQVLHYFDDPLTALEKAKEYLAPNGRLLIVDYGPHNHEVLRIDYAHRRLGFAPEQMDSFAKKLQLDAIAHQMLAPKTNGAASQALSNLKAGVPNNGLQIHIWLFQANAR